MWLCRGKGRWGGTLGLPRGYVGRVSFAFGVFFFVRVFDFILNKYFLALFQFFKFFVGPKEGHFQLVFVRKCAFRKRWDPRFCTLLQRLNWI